MIACYYRLSGADGDLGKDGKDESNSIENQRSLVMEFLESREDLRGKETREFIDDGYTGSNFHRPGFESMIEGVRDASVDTIVVKDLSRFGRNYLEVGEYLEEVFPLFRIRFIAINDRYDSDNYKGTTMGIEMVVSNLVNSMYSRDSGRKLYSANKIKWQKGYSTMGTTPFGYKRSPNGRYVIEEGAAKTVRRIFDLALEGKGTRQISDVLNEEGHLIPSAYNRVHGIRNNGGAGALNPDEIWDCTKVWRIIRNEAYMGTMVLGKVQKRGGRPRRVKRSEMFVTPGVNEAIVTEDEWKSAQEVIRKPREKQGFGVNLFPLKGKIRCGHCRCVMSHNFQVYEPKVWCSIGRESKYSGCGPDRYSIGQIESTVFWHLNHYLRAIQALEKGFEGKKKEANDRKRKKEKQEEHCKRRMDAVRAEKMRCYENYVAGMLSLEQFQDEKNKLDEQMAKIHEEVERLRQIQIEEPVVSSDAEKVMQLASCFLGEEKLTERMAEAFIECVYMHEGGRMEIVFRCGDELMRIAEQFDLPFMKKEHEARINALADE